MEFTFTYICWSSSEICVLVDLSMSSVWAGASLTWLCRAEKKANEKCGTCISSPDGIQVVFLIFAAKSRDSCFAHHPSQPCKSRFLSFKLFVAGLVFRRSIKKLFNLHLKWLIMRLDSPTENYLTFVNSWHGTETANHDNYSKTSLILPLF